MKDKKLIAFFFLFALTAAMVASRRIDRAYFTTSGLPVAETRGAGIAAAQQRSASGVGPRRSKADRRYLAAASLAANGRSRRCGSGAVIDFGGAAAPGRSGKTDRPGFRTGAPIRRSCGPGRAGAP